MTYTVGHPYTASIYVRVNVKLKLKSKNSSPAIGRCDMGLLPFDVKTLLVKLQTESLGKHQVHYDISTFSVWH